MEGLRKVTLTIIVREYQAEEIAEEFADSHLASIGLCCIDGGSIKKLTGNDIEAVKSIVPEEILDDMAEED